MADFYEYSTPELVRLLGSRFKDYRMRCNLTQKEVAEQSGIGLTTIHKFENGTAGNLSLSTFISLLRVVGQVNWTMYCQSCLSRLTLFAGKRRRLREYVTPIRSRLI